LVKKSRGGEVPMDRTFYQTIKEHFSNSI